MLDDEVLVQFLLKNLKRNSAGGYHWKFRLNKLEPAYQEVLSGIDTQTTFEGKTLFVKGSESNYVQHEDEEIIKSIFPNASIETIEKAGHWVHADQPEPLLTLIEHFLK